MTTYYRVNLRDKENNIVYPNIHNLISIDSIPGNFTLERHNLILSNGSISLKQDGSKVSTVELEIIGNKGNTSTGGSIVLNAPRNNPKFAGTLIYNFENSLRIKGIPSLDGTTQTGTGTEYIINPYTKTLTGGFTTIGIASFAQGQGNNSTTEGGEIHLDAAPKGPTYAGTIIDNNSGQCRIFGIPSADKTTKTGPGTPLVIDPYAKTITGGYTMTGNVNGQLTSSVTTSSYISGNKGINVIINGTAAAGYNVLARQKSTNGVFTLAAFNNSYYLNYTSDTNINNGVNGVNAAVRLLDENGNSAFPGTVNVNKLYGSIELPNNTWNKIGDDVYLGDVNQGGCLCLKGANAETGICFVKKDDASKVGHLRYNGNFYFSAPFCGLVHNELSLHLENTTTNKGWSMISSNYNGFILKTIRTQQNAPAWICGDYSSGIAFGGADTHGVISVRYPEPEIKFAGGNSDKPRWYITIKGSSEQCYTFPTIGTRIPSARDDTTRFFRSGTIATWNSNYSGYDNGTVMFCW